MADFQFRIYHAISRKLIRRVKLNNAEYNDPVFGRGGSLSAEAPITEGQSADALKEAIEQGLDRHALYVFRDNVLVWGGPLISHDWQWKERKLIIGAVQWKQWLYNKMLTPDMTVNPVKDKVYSWVNVDQFEITRGIISNVIADYGTPNILLGTELSGKLRDLTIYGMKFQTAGDAIDSMANRDGGFDWELLPRVNAADGLPELVLALYYPERGTFNQGMSLRFKSTQRGGNIILPDSFDVSAETRRSRVWATGTGTPPDQLVVFDEDPELEQDIALTRESVSGYPDVVKSDTLADHARAERQFLGVPMNSISVSCSLEDPPLENYRSGDRARMIIKDEWLDIDLPAVRIVDRTIRLNQSDEPDSATLLLNLNDFEIAENVVEVNE